MAENSGAENGKTGNRLVMEMTGHMEIFVLLFIFLSATAPLVWCRARRDASSPRRIGRRI